MLGVGISERQGSRMRIAVKVLIALVILLIAMAGGVYAMSARRIHAKFTVSKWRGKSAEATPESIEKGKHIAVVRGCLECHGQDASGGLYADAMPVMRLVPANITSGSATKNYSDADWEAAVRHCVRPNGDAIPFMPCIDNARLSDSDLSYLITYLRSMKPVEKATEPTSIGPVGRVLFLLGRLPYVHAELIDHTVSAREAPPAGPSPEYGAYLADTCIGCHGERMSGGPIPGVPPEWPPAANITPDATGLKDWTKEQFFTVLRTGVRPDERVIDPQYMPWKQFAQFTDEEANALWLHLRGLRPRPRGER